MPSTPLMSATADAKLLIVGPVLASSSPLFFLSIGLLAVGQAGSVYGAKPPTPVKVTSGSAIVASVGQPMPVSHSAWTRNVLPGSNSRGTTSNASNGASATVMPKSATERATIQRFLIRFLISPPSFLTPRSHARGHSHALWAPHDDPGVQLGASAHFPRVAHP